MFILDVVFFAALFIGWKAKGWWDNINIQEKHLLAKIKNYFNEYLG